MAFKRKRLSKKQVGNWKRLKRSIKKSTNKNKPLFGKKRFKKQSLQRGKPNKQGTGHWLTTTKTSKKMPSWLNIKLKGTNSGFVNINQATQGVSVIGQQAIVSGTRWNMWTPFDITTSIAALGTNLNQTVLINCQIKLFGTNQSNAVQFLEFYEVVNKRDVMQASTKVNTPMVAWSTASSLQQGVNSTNPGSTPFEFQSFTTFYKVLKITRYNLNPGETFEHIWSDTENKVMHPQTILEWNVDANSTEGLGGIKGVTKWLFGVQWSAPYNDTTTKTQITLGAGNIDYVITKKFSVKQIVGLSSSDSTNVNSLVQAFTVAEDIMVDDSGAASALVNA